MNRFNLPRRDFLALTGGALASATVGARAWAEMAPLNFGYQTTSWGTIGMVVEAEGLFQKAGDWDKILDASLLQEVMKGKA
jgi:hypothetical protein